jgi:ribosomal protein S18 acetylase RimI-like enzyme
MVIYVTPALGVTLRPYTDQDRRAVLELINADRLPGQPLAGPSMLADALAGRSAIDSGWWEELRTPTTAVATDPNGAVLGVVSYAVRPHDRTGLILWMHCRENPAVARELIGHAAAALADCRALEAFQFASALTLGLEGLPVGHRPATHAALIEAGFTGRDEWRYMRRTLPVAGLPRLAAECEVSPDGWRLTARQDGAVVTEATVSVSAGTGVLWWISVDAAVRGRGLGRGMLGSALEHLTGLGAREVILYVDDASGDPEADRSAANSLYEKSGFTEIDRLYSYTESNSV